MDEWATSIAHCEITVIMWKIKATFRDRNWVRKYTCTPRGKWSNGLWLRYALAILVYCRKTGASRTRNWALYPAHSQVSFTAGSLLCPGMLGDGTSPTAGQRECPHAKPWLMVGLNGTQTWNFETISLDFRSFFQVNLVPSVPRL